MILVHIPIRAASLSGKAGRETYNDVTPYSAANLPSALP
jgi:hypothetical protein